MNQFYNYDFFNGQETSELIRMIMQKTEREFYRGILQSAVSLYRLGKNTKGACFQKNKAEIRLKPFQPRYRGTRLESQLRESTNLIFGFALNKTKFYNETSEINYPRLIWHESSF